MYAYTLYNPAVRIKQLNPGFSRHVNSSVTGFTVNIYTKCNTGGYTRDCLFHKGRVRIVYTTRVLKNEDTTFPDKVSTV